MTKWMRTCSQSFATGMVSITYLRIDYRQRRSEGAAHTAIPQLILLCRTLDSILLYWLLRLCPQEFAVAAPSKLSVYASDYRVGVNKLMSYFRKTYNCKTKTSRFFFHYVLKYIIELYHYNPTRNYIQLCNSKLF